MTAPVTLADTALAFAREILGWEYPVDRASVRTSRGADGKESRAWGPYLFRCHGQNPDFYYTDLNVVPQAVRAWCDERESALEFGCYGYSPGEWEVEVDTPVSAERATNPNPCFALMAACLETNRKTRALHP